MTLIGTTLGQLRPGNTTAVSVYSPPSTTQAQITKIVVCNTAATTQKFRIFLDHDGTTYDETTALFWDIVTPTDTTVEIDGDWWMTDSAGNLAVRTDSASAFTFTVFGAEHQV
jgi:hypothetical protein